MSGVGLRPLLRYGRRLVEVRIGRPVLSDLARYIVVGLDVVDRAVDVGGLLASAGRIKDLGLQLGRSAPVDISLSGESRPPVLVHAGQCLTVKHYGHESSVRDRFATWYRELSS